MIKGTLYVEDNFLNNKIFCEKQNIKSYYKFSKYINIKMSLINTILIDTKTLPKKVMQILLYLDYLKDLKEKNYLIVDHLLYYQKIMTSIP